MSLFFFFWDYVAQIALKLMILQPQPSKHWDHRCVLLSPAPTLESRWQFVSNFSISSCCNRIPETGKLKNKRFFFGSCSVYLELGVYMWWEPCCLKWWQELKNKEMCWVHVGEPCFMTTSAFVATISPILASAVAFSWELGLHDPSLSAWPQLLTLAHYRFESQQQFCWRCTTLKPQRQKRLRASADSRHRLGAKVLLISSPAVQGHPWGDCWCMTTSNPCFCSDFRIVLGKQIGLLTRWPLW